MCFFIIFVFLPRFCVVHDIALIGRGQATTRSEAAPPGCWTDRCFSACIIKRLNAMERDGRALERVCISVWTKGRSSLVKVATLLSILFVSLQLGCSRQSLPEPVTVSFLDPEWSHDTTDRKLASDAALRKFTEETGIRVNHLPAPESSPEQLALIRQLLQKGTGSPDVLAIDVIWPRILQQHLQDLKPDFTDEAASDDEALLANFTVDGRLLATPYHTDIGVLSYRTDLLKEYGFPGPPRTWADLEKMASRIQEGERAKGNKIFGDLCGREPPAKD
jgi:ABC-type glycerol-3-phosphate transport system substrate-binding protein